MDCGLSIIGLLILYILWDVNYFIRVIYTVGLARLFQKKCKITDTTRIYGNFFLHFIEYHFIKDQYFH